ncbi:MAG: putative phage tail protein [Smithella sp.]
MARIVDDYLQALLQLLPLGKVYPRDLQGVLPHTLKALADELARVDIRVDNLIDEADPRTTMEMLSDWERVINLSASDSITKRRLAIVSKLTSIGGQSRKYFIQLAASLGYTITITEFRPFTCVTSIDQGIYEETCRFTWQVNAPETTIITGTCQSACSEPLREWGNDELESAIKAVKPAHTSVIFSYGG